MQEFGDEPIAVDELNSATAKLPKEYLTRFPIYRDRIEQIFRQYGLVAVSGTNAY